MNFQKPQAYIIIGPSGAGKGTQADLLIKRLGELDKERGVFYVQVGKEFRKFVEGQSETQKLSKTIQDEGRLQPEFIAIYQWANLLVNQYNGKDHILFDGSPRKYDEAVVLDSIYDFYSFDKPWLIYLDVHHEEARSRLIKRGRMDDHHDAINQRLSWFETEVKKTVEFYRNNSKYKFLDIDGNRDIETVHKDIVKSVGLE